MPQFEQSKLYCYVDETGQDTLGDFFIVAVIISGSDRDSLVAQLETIERASGKGKTKWMFTEIPNLTWLLLCSPRRAILAAAPLHSGTTVYVDGLPKSRLRWFGTELRRLSVRNSKVVGVRREEADSLMCLADALAGFVRLALSGRDPAATALLQCGKHEGTVREV